MVVTKLVVHCDCCSESHVEVASLDDLEGLGWRVINGSQFCIACYGTFTFIAKAMGIEKIPEDPSGLEEAPKAKTKRFKVIHCRFYGKTNEITKDECSFGIGIFKADKYARLSEHERKFHPLAYKHLPASKKGRGYRVPRVEAWRYYK